MVNYGNTNQFLAIIGLVSLVIYLSIFNGIAGIFINKSINRGYNVFFIIPSIWVVKDFIIEKLFGGFPWEFIGYSQINNFYFVQNAEIGGIYLISFLVILINIYLAFSILDKNKTLFKALLVILVVIYLTGYILNVYNLNKISDIKHNKAGILQPNWYYKSKAEYLPIRKKLNILFNKSISLMNKGAEFVIWPEYTVSIYPTKNPYYMELFENFTQKNIPIFAGFIDVKTRNEFYNTIFLFTDKGYQKYDKTRLTPFGEYVPFRKLLFFVKKITRGISDFSAGKIIKNLTLNNHKLSTPICYEIIYPEIVREFINKGGEVILTISNDSWFGNTSAPHQHLSMARMRAIENRRYVLRSTSTGISALIDSTGKLLYKSPIYKEDEFIVKFKYIKYKTLYVKVGYLFPYILSIILFFIFIKEFLIRKFKREEK